MILKAWIDGMKLTPVLVRRMNQLLDFGIGSLYLIQALAGKIELNYYDNE